MKNKAVITAILTLIGSILFYDTSIGINIFIFTILSLITIIISKRQVQLKKLLIKSIPVLLCSVYLLIYPQKITFIFWLISYLSLWVNLERTFKPLLVPLAGLLSIIITPFKIFRSKKQTANGNMKKQRSHKFKIFLISGFIIFWFCILYISSNPIFSSLFKSINLDFLDFGFIKTYIKIFILLIGLTSIEKIKKIEIWNLKKLIVTEQAKNENQIIESKIAKIIVWTLGGLLLLLNSTDIVVIITGHLPKGINYSEYVHQGFYTIIFTLSLSIAFITYFFRSNIYFQKQIVTIRKGAIFWISQNLIVAICTAYKNYLYVEAYGLTYKRIAVFCFMICIVIGLILSIIKVQKTISNWHYFNVLTKYAFISLLCITLIPFDQVITHYNLNYSKTKDISYLLSLKNPDLLAIREYNDLNNLGYEFEIKVEISLKKDESKTISWSSWNYYNEKNKGL